MDTLASSRVRSSAVALIAMFALALSLLLAVQAPAADAATNSTYEAQVLSLVNQHRKNAGCGALIVDARLTNAARAHSADMANRNYFDHNTAGSGATPFARMAAAGYPSNSGMGENIAAGQTTPAAAVSGWMNSAGHRANILNCSYRAVGTGYWSGGSFRHYWTQDFGTVLPAPAGPKPLQVSATNKLGGASSIGFIFGWKGDRAISCDFDGNGTDGMGLFRAGVFYLRNSMAPSATSSSLKFGSPGDLPLCGDWNADGKDTVGVYRPSNATFYLRNTNSTGTANLTFPMGVRGDLPVSGDFDGNRVDTVGVYRPSTATFYILNVNSRASTRYGYKMGVTGDKPLVGDFNADGKDTLGVRRGSTFYLRTSMSSTATISFAYGLPTDAAMLGDWDGNGVDAPSVTR